MNPINGFGYNRLEKQGTIITHYEVFTYGLYNGASCIYRGVVFKIQNNEDGIEYPVGSFVSAQAKVKIDNIDVDQTYYFTLGVYSDFNSAKSSIDEFDKKMTF